MLKYNLRENSVSLFLNSSHFKILFFLAEVKNEEPACGCLANSVLRYTCLFPRDAVTNGYKPSILKQQRFFLTLLESKSSKSGCQEGMLSSEDSEEESVLASSWLLGVVILTLLGLHHGTQSLSPQGLLLCICVLSSFKVLGSQPQPRITSLLPSASSKTLFPNKVTFGGSG